jgi:signal transduction histidine kinase
VDNLVSNALKFSYSNTQVSVRIWTREGRAFLSVEDQGQGIRQSDFDKVFRKFARLEARPTAGESSTGLGLSIVAALAEVVGGKISFDSEWGKGTIFTLSIPLES